MAQEIPSPAPSQILLSPMLGEGLAAGIELVDFSTYQLRNYAVIKLMARRTFRRIKLQLCRVGWCNGNV